MEVGKIGENLQKYLEEQLKIHENDKEGKQYKFVKIVMEILFCIRQSASLNNNPLEQNKHITQLIRLFEMTKNMHNYNDLQSPIFIETYNQLQVALEELSNQEQHHLKTIGLLGLKNKILNFPNQKDTETVIKISFESMQNDENKVRELSSELPSIQLKSLKEFIQQQGKLQGQEENKEGLSQIENHTQDIFKKYCQFLSEQYVKVNEKEIETQKQIQSKEQEQYLASQGEEEIINQKYIDLNFFSYDGKMKTYAESYLWGILCLINYDLLQVTVLEEESSNEQMKQLREILQKSMGHGQKFIRETTLKIVSIILKKNQLNKGKFHEQLAAMFSELIKIGLQDNYTNVRVQAMKTGFEFVEFTDKNMKLIQPLLSPLCFNRHHPAEGLHTYSRQTWMDVFQQSGRQLMGDNIESSIQYYYTQCFNRNYEIRNAACICFNELVTRIVNINDDTLAVFYKNLTKIALALINCIFFEVNSIVREEALKTMVNLLEYKGKFTSKAVLESIEKSCFFHLPDQSIEVKQNSAMIITLLYSDNLDQLKQKLTNELNTISDPDKIQKELENVEKYVQNISKEKLVIRHMSDYLEGYAFMAREICLKDVTKQDEALQYVKLIMDNFRKLQFNQIENIGAHIIQIVDSMLQKLDKKFTKSSIELIVDPLFRAAKHSSENGQQIMLPFVTKLFQNMAAKIGYQILRGRIEQHDLGQFANEFEMLNVVNPADQVA